MAEVLGGRRVHVNLLHYNPTGAGLQGARYDSTPADRADHFAQCLRESGVIAHFRRPRGPDIDAACGQLRVRSGAGQAR